jgi:prepilin-type N-terminal cleavage/methylation domain-containing protein
VRRSRGFTLPELMVSLAVIGATGAMTVAVGSGVRAEQRQADASARDVAAATRALRLAAEDVRAGRFEDAGWTVTQDVLSRGAEVVARGVRTWSVRADGPATRVTITLDRRNFDAGTQGSITATEVVRTRAKETP